MKYKTLKSMKGWKGKRVLVRADFNVPVDANGKIKDTFRIDATLPTLEYLRKKGAKIVVVSHMGTDGKESLAVVRKYLNKKFKIDFSKEVIGASVIEKAAKMKNGDALLLENVRREKGEMANDKNFAKALANLADVYVNEAFSVSHRKHASLVGVPKFLPALLGLQCEAEVSELSKAYEKVRHPFLFILGGAKFDTKLPLLKRFIVIADQVFVGGALAHNFFRIEGYEIGKSLIDEDVKGLEKIAKKPNLLLPVDLLVENKNSKREIGLDEVEKDDTIVDMGHTSLALLETYVKKAKMIVWNGPLGKGENIAATKALLKMLARSKAVRIVGGGDTVEVISRLKLIDKVGFVSTGGGATIDFLADGSLPALEILKK